MRECLSFVDVGVEGLVLGLQSCPLHACMGLCFQVSVSVDYVSRSLTVAISFGARI